GLLVLPLVASETPMPAVLPPPSRTRQRLFGLETEYAFAAFDPAGGRASSSHVLQRLMDAVRNLVPTLADRRSHGGMFLANGSRLYIDCGHPELATVECTTPDELVRYILAGDRLLSDACRKLVEARVVADTFLARSNIGYGPYPTTWGCHESYSYT